MVRSARRRLLLVWVLALAWVGELVMEPLGPLFLLLAGVGVIVAVATLIEPAWLGSPIRPLIAMAIPVAAIGVIAAAVVV